MPQLQVLNQQLDPSVAIMQQGTQDINAQLAKQNEDMTALGALKVKIEQMKINAKNAATEQDKLKYQRLVDGLTFLTKLKEMGADPELVLPALKNAIGDDASLEALQVAGESLGKAPSAAKQAGMESEEKMAGQLRAVKGAGFGGGAGIGSGAFPPGSQIKAGPLTMPLTRKYTQSESQMLATASMLTNEISSLIDIIETNPSAQYMAMVGPKGVGKEGQRFAWLKKSVGERLLRLRSGAQINEKEYQRFMDLLPSIFRGDEVDIEALNQFRKEFQEIQARILRGSAYDFGGGMGTYGTSGGQAPVVIDGYKVEVE
jgi:hypothetical protein